MHVGERLIKAVLSVSGKHEQLAASVDVRRNVIRHVFRQGATVRDDDE